MNRYAYKPGPVALVIYLIAAVILAAAVNAVIVFSGAAEWTEGLNKPVFALSGLQMGLMWEFLLACMAAAYWFVRRTPPLPDRRAASIALLAMVLVVLSFPFYALLPHSLLNAFVGTFASAFIAWIVFGVVTVNSRRAGLLLLPLAVWLSFASVVAFHVHRLNPARSLLG